MHIQLIFRFTSVLFLLFSGLTVAGQFEDPPDRKPTEPAIIFHPYYNDVQLIEIDNLGRWNDEVNHYEMTRPRALQWSSVLPPPAPNVYLFRHRNGTIVKAFNTKSSLEELTRKYGKLQ
ncbi:MAG: hypothetical protein JNM19_09610, partial [Chitinophagaceae bacterium]|nr:hypothetical protein [Chitinophagaceae bacterium]